MAIAMSDVAQLQDLRGVRQIGHCSLEHRWTNRVYVVPDESETIPEDEAGTLLVIGSPRLPVLAAILGRCTQQPVMYAGVVLSNDGDSAGTVGQSLCAPLAALAAHMPVLVLPPGTPCTGIAEMLTLDGEAAL